MAKEAHTPGPWWLDETDPGAFEVCGKLNGFCADIVLSSYFDNPADAHLIAAAPEGLEIAEEFLAFARSGKAFSYPPGSLQKLEQFIAKARGEAQ